MKYTVEYTFDDYPNVQVVAYKGVNGTLETNLDKILSNLLVGKNKYGQTTVSFDTVDKYVDISNHYMSDNTGDWMTISIANLENSKREFNEEKVMSKFKVGDKVKLISINETYESYGYDCDEMMNISDVGIIFEMDDTEIVVAYDGEYFSYHIDDLELVSE